MKRKMSEEEIRLNELEKYTTQVYDNLYKHIRLIQYKMWQYNNATNIILYNEILSKLTPKSNFHPLVSIIIPTYNGANFIQEAIHCALSQTYDNLEIIVVDDGSTDNTEKILSSYGDKIQYYTKKNGGVSSALNYGIGKMHGDYFSWLSHDDLIAPTHIEKLVQWVSYEENDNDIPFTSFRIVDGHGHINLQDTITSQIHCNDFKISYVSNELSLLQGEINGGSILIPTKAFKECGIFDEKLRISQERDMWSRLIKKYHLINIPFDTASIRTHNKRVTNTNQHIDDETNAKTLEILDSITLHTKQQLFGDEYSFYENLKYYYENHNKTYLVEKVNEKLSGLQNGKAS